MTDHFVREPSPEFVTRINEIFHDAEGDTYSTKHDEIFVREMDRWARLIRRFILPRRPVTVVDFGSGTGFVPLQLLPYLDAEDTIVCCDISQRMLDVAAAQLRKRDARAKLEFVKLDGDLDRVAARSADVMTVNSVLHHLAEPDAFFRWAHRCLVDNGLLVVVHEPNRLFFSHPFLRMNYLVLVRVVSRLNLRKTRVKGALPSDPVVDAVNRTLLQEGLVPRPLSEREIVALVDYRSPTAWGGAEPGGGFDTRVWQRRDPRFELVFEETYDHCSKVSARNRVLRGYDRLLAWVFPRRGSLMSFVLEKRADVAGVEAMVAS